MITDLITEVKSAIAIPKNSPFTQAKAPKAEPPGFLLYTDAYDSLSATCITGRKTFLPDDIILYAFIFCLYLQASQRTG